MALWCFVLETQGVEGMCTCCHDGREGERFPVEFAESRENSITDNPKVTIRNEDGSSLVCQSASEQRCYERSGYRPWTTAVRPPNIPSSQMKVLLFATLVKMALGLSKLYRL